MDDYRCLGLYVRESSMRFQCSMWRVLNYKCAYYCADGDDRLVRMLRLRTLEEPTPEEAALLAALAGRARTCSGEEAYMLILFVVEGAAQGAGADDVWVRLHEWMGASRRKRQCDFLRAAQGLDLAEDDVFLGTLDRAWEAATRSSRVPPQWAWWWSTCDFAELVGRLWDVRERLSVDVAEEWITTYAQKVLRCNEEWHSTYCHVHSGKKLCF